MRSRSWRGALCVVAAVAAITGCSKGNALSGPPTSEGGDSTTTVPTSSTGGPCADAAADGPIDGSALLACLGPSVVFIDTPGGSGSGVLIDGGYLVTNAHVVDPFSTVNVTFEDGESFTDVPVDGTDLMADIAVLGPIDTDRPSVAFEDPTGNDKGSDVFLIGYPGETDADHPELTISRGVLSRFRELDDFGLTFLQTDAAIGSGQSGGALVDANGRVIGTSGLYYDEFAYAISGPDVQDSIEAITSGEVSEYRALPIADSSTTASIHVENPEIDEGWVVLPYLDEATTVRITLTSSAVPIFVVADLFTGEPTFVSQSAVDLYGGAGQVGDAGMPDGGREIEPGVFEVDVPAQSYLLAVFGATTGPADVSFESSVPVSPVPDLDQSTPIALGDSIDAVVDYFESNDSYVIDLAVGDRVTITVSSPTGDMAYAVQAPGQAYLDAEIVDDSNVGLLGFDAEDAYEATTAGPHVIRVVSNDGLSTGYRITISAG